jgi:hypothetical protein
MNSASIRSSRYRGDFVNFSAWIVNTDNKESGESFSTFSASVPRAAFEIIKEGKMWVKRKTQKNTAI